MRNARVARYQYYREGNTLRVRESYAPAKRQRKSYTFAKRPVLKKNAAKKGARKRVDPVRVGKGRRAEPEAALKLRALSGTMSLPLTLLLTVMVVVVLYFGFGYLRLSASIDEHMDNIQTLENQLETLKNQNDAIEEGIDTSINLNEIYDAATGRLGMVRADGSSVITYDKSESEYVRQYDSVPSAD